MKIGEAAGNECVNVELGHELYGALALKFCCSLARTPSPAAREPLFRTKGVTKKICKIITRFSCFLTSICCS